MWSIIPRNRPRVRFIINPYIIIFDAVSVVFVKIFVI